MIHILLLVIVEYCLGAPLPSQSRTCGTGDKVKISETILPSVLVDDNQIFFLEKTGSMVSSEIVILRTTDGRVMRSTDGGQTWEEETVPERMQNIEGNKIRKIFPVETKDEITIYFLGDQENGKFWVTSNGGTSYSYFDTLPHTTYDLIPHPQTPNQLALAICTSQSNPDRRQVWIGSHIKWDLVLDNLPYYSIISWSSLSNTDSKRIYALMDNGISGIFDGEIIYSDNFFTTTEQKIPGLNGVYNWLMVPPNRFVVSTCTSQNTACDTKELHISEDGGKTFTTAVFPDFGKDTPDEKDFQIELEDNAIWVHVSRECTDELLCWGDTFHSHSAKQKFTLSLRNQRREDFTKYYSVDGIYVANQYVTSGRNTPRPGDPVRTLITYNKGSDWELIKAPQLDANGQPTNCNLEDHCSLHIHGWVKTSTFFTYFYSVPNAIGIMLATGNIGTKLDENNWNAINTYISYNGGVEWEEVRKGPWVPEIGDHGSIITMVQQTEDTNTLRYTINGGNEWLTCQFADQLMDVTNIRVSDGWDSRRFLVYGKRKIDNVDRAVLVHFNFDDAFSGKCVFPDDYEEWSPFHEHGYCVLGAKTIYMRRKNGRDCYFGEDHEHVTTVSNCTCTLNDLECDHCFYRPDLASPCTLECIVPEIPEEPAYCINSTETNQLYFETEFGYRFIPGDTCNNFSSDLKPKGRIPCKFSSDVAPQPVQPLVSKEAETVVAILLVLAATFAIASISFGLVWKSNPAFRTAVKDLVGWEKQHYSMANVDDDTILDEDNIKMEDED